jgi:GNAT superfamily N-acetyltransferase
MGHPTLMNQPSRPAPRKSSHRWLRSAFSVLPQRLRFAAYRRIVDCDPAPSTRLELKIAETQGELEACFALLHDAYVSSGFMQPHPSGLRVTPYHALPTTTTLCAKFDGQVAGTLSIVREGVFGFPMQSAFELSAVRAREGRIAEISALAVHPDFRRTGGSILFPLMKFMYEYCTQYFDTRHLVIAVNPNRIELYEALLMFERLQAQAVDRYDFANGAPAIGATLDLQAAPRQFLGVYGGRSERRDLHRYFVETRLPNIHHPGRSYFTSNDPVLTPALLDHFFNRRTDTLARLDPRRLQLLHSVYAGDDWARVLPGSPPLGAAARPLRQHPRFSMKCPATLEHAVGRTTASHHATLVEISLHGFQARMIRPLAIGTRFAVRVVLGDGLVSQVEAELVRHVPSTSGHFHGFRVEAPDAAWRRCVAALSGSQTHAELSRQAVEAAAAATTAASESRADLLPA